MTHASAATARTSVAIVGAGLSGLCLAQHLHRHGIDVRVHERDAGPFVRPQGYRITVDRDGLTALRESLPAQLYELAIAVAGSPGGYFRFTNRRLREAFRITVEPSADAERQMDRQVLRSVLLVGLEDRVHFGRAAVAIDPDASGGTRLLFEDGSSVTADVVIAADGVGSTLRRQVLPDGDPERSGMAGVYGRTPLVRDGRRVLPAALDRSGVLALGETGGRAVFFTAMEFGRAPTAAFADHAPGRPVVDVDDYVMWGVVLREDDLPVDEAARTDPRTLWNLAVDASADFHPLVRRLVATAEPDATVLSLFPIGRRPGPWAVPNAALMGDAVHPMPPFGAHGGNTALRDAALLGAKLRAAYAAGGSPDAIAEALAAYREEMVPYAFQAVDTAVGMMRRLTSSRGIHTWVMLKLLPSLRRRIVPET